MSVAMDHKVSILIVDDQPEGLIALDAILEPLEQNLIRASSGRDALRQILKHDFALILLDVVMPDMDGFETAKLIRERSRNRDTPIIFLTALSRGEMPTSKAYQLGAVDYILKPIDPDVLRSKVAVFVDLARKTELIKIQAEALREAERREHEMQLAEAKRRLDEERQRAREDLLRREVEVGQQERQWLEAVLNALPTPLVLVQPDTGTALFVNHAARKLPWQHAARAPGALTFTDRDGITLTPEQLPLARAARGEHLDGFHVQWRDDVSHGSFLSHSERLPNMWGHDETILVTMLDVTKLTDVEKRLQTALQVRDSFLSIASHELKTPLTTIGLQVQRIMRAQKRGEFTLPPTAGRDPIALLDRAFGRLNTLVSDLLDVSRIQAGKLEMNLAEMDLADLVRDVTTQMREEFTLAKCPLEIELEEPLIGYWDRSRLEQVVANLSTNALKYAVGKPVRITLHREGEAAVLRVTDQGIGIAPEDQPRIFQRFERAASEREYGGLGLGLWIVGQIVSNLGGQIGVKSALGQGATFEVRLPLAQSQLMAASA